MKTHQSARLFPGGPAVPAGPVREQSPPSRANAARLSALAIAILSFTLTSALRAQPSPKPAPAREAPSSTPNADRERDSDRLQDEALAAYRAGDFATSETKLREQCKIDPSNFVPFYNLACTRAAQGEHADALEWLKKAIGKGFVDVVQLEKDPALAGVRALPEFKALMDRWGAILEKHRDANLTLAKSHFPLARQSHLDEALRLSYLSAFDEHSFNSAREELTKLADWGNTKLFPGLLDAGASARDPWVVVILPAREDYQKWAVGVFGPGVLQGLSTVGGNYDQDSKRLVAQDLGPTLRHEFFHVLHWRSMSRLNQRHPLWVMEGLCSLVEDYDVIDGAISPVPSWRTNTVKRMERTRLIIPFREFAKKPNSAFRAERRMGMYAQSRAIFLYLWQKGKLADWYARYTKDFTRDQSGVDALEQTLGMTAEDFDKDFKSWIRALPEVPERLKSGMASLGVEADAGGGEGPIVASPGRARAGLAQGDVITALDGQPTRDLPELLRRLGSLRPGQTVAVSIRRGGKHMTLPVPLVAAP